MASKNRAAKTTPDELLATLTELMAWEVRRLERDQHTATGCDFCHRGAGLECERKGPGLSAGEYLLALFDRVLALEKSRWATPEIKRILEELKTGLAD